MPFGRELLPRPRPGQEAAPSTAARRRDAPTHSGSGGVWSTIAATPARLPVAPMSAERRAYFGQPPLRVSAPGDALERAADRTADAMLAGEASTHDFSRVRLHTGPDAAQAARALDARAFTV